ncbi:MAG: class I SAM-dependent methyltransferase [Flavobacteriaceae bacterium]|nr:class I SAM-dependent methyltransferase [Flavobacteriaceae bacterium]
MSQHSSAYNSSESNHYRAYRPPLHKLILSRILKDRHFEIALDIGCGVGTSSLTLVPYAKRVIGYDPSQAMIEKTTPHSAITYTNLLDKLPSSCDLLCFFGSLEYIDARELEKYTQKLVKGGQLICCDFEVDYQPILEKIGLEPMRADYKHSKNLTDYPNHKGFKEHLRQVEPTSFNCSIEQLKSLLYAEFENMGESTKVIDSAPFERENYELKAFLYYTTYTKL